MYLSELQSQSTIWSTRRNVWIRGPDIPNVDFKMANRFFYQAMQFSKTFPLVVNSTTIILIGGDISKENNHTISRYPGVTCVNILTNKWTPYPNMPNHVYTHSTTFLAAVSFDKSRKRYSQYHTWSYYMVLLQSMLFSFFQDTGKLGTNWLVIYWFSKIFYIVAKNLNLLHDSKFRAPTT